MGGGYLCSFMSVNGKHTICLLSTRNPFRPTPVALRIFAISDQELMSHSLYLFHLFSTLHSAVRVQLIGVENVISV